MLRRLIALLLLACALPARAGLFDDEVARQRIERLQGSIDALTQQTELATRNQVEFANQAETIKTELAKVRGQLEELSYRLEAAEKRQRDFYVDLDNRLRKIEQVQVATAQADAKPAVDPAQETRDYEAALAALKASRFKEAQAGFAAFIKAYPSSGMLASAHFWSGYCFTQTKEPAKAAEMYGRLAATWPNDVRAADALAAQATALEAAGDKTGAKQAQEALRERYPDSDAAKALRPSRKK
ncbi:MAG: tetratricopeptide repeat protein [Rhodocyclaceae bacterium]|nr:tetratricopeptide repeat protein [Rhodocyclaceae bacterium]